MQALDSLLPHNAGERKTLADMIFAKLDGTADMTAVIKDVPQGASGLLKSQDFY